MWCSDCASSAECHCIYVFLKTTQVWKWNSIKFRKFTDKRMPIESYDLSVVQTFLSPPASKSKSLGLASALNQHQLRIRTESVPLPLCISSPDRISTASSPLLSSLRRPAFSNNFLPTGLSSICLLYRPDFSGLK